jgi:RNA polymerase sigma-70 factor (ECF subfamily)
MVAAHQGAILNYVYRLVGDIDVAEELTQDTFVKAYRALERLDLDQDKAYLRRAWLYRIAQNTATDHLRRRARLRWFSLDNLTRAETPPAPAADPAEVPDEREPVRRVLASLDEAQRHILLLFNHEGLSADEVADVLGISAVAARKRRQRASETFRERYLELVGSPPDPDPVHGSRPDDPASGPAPAAEPASDEAPAPRASLEARR